MAIYRKGEASLAADGTVTGYGTNWKDQLALVRIGATVVFLTGNAISAIGTVSAIVSETQLQTIQTDGAVVARGKYFILLHDSLTVDGLAQNVAETLRYYQSQETEIAEAMDYFRTFDWERFEKLATQVKNNASAAKVSEVNAKTSETNAKASENSAASSKSAATASQLAAKTSETNAKTSETNAKASENAANGSKVAAAGSATAADASAKAGAASQAAAKTSETNAKTSETNAKASENASLQSKNAAAGSATAAKTSETNSKTSETNSKASETKAKTSETNAKTSEINAENWAKSIKPENLAQLDAENTFQKKQTVKAGMTINASYSDSLLLESVNPTIKFRETDKPSGAPDYSFVFDGGNFQIQRDDNGASLLSYNKDINTITIVRGAFTDPAGTRNNLGIGESDNVRFGMVSANGVDMRSNGGSTSPALVASVFASNGTTLLGQAEFRSNQNGNLELINRAGGTPMALTLATDGGLSWSGNRISSALNVNAEINAGGVIGTSTSAGAFRTGKANNGYGSLSTEGNYTMIWRRYEGAGTKTAEFLGMNGDSAVANSTRVLFRKATGTGASDYQDRVVIHLPPSTRSGNVDADANGFIKLASPIVKLMGDGSADINDEANGASVSRVGVGEYLIEGVLGLNADAVWGGVAGGIEIPRDMNGQPRIWVDYEVSSDGNLMIRTYHREHLNSPAFARNKIDGFSDGDPIDIPSDVFVSVRVEMPNSEKIIYGNEPPLPEWEELTEREDSVIVE